MPVFVFGDTAYGPRDKISSFRVADIVYDWAREPNRTEDEQAIAGRFLRQLPDGPQLDRVPGVRGQPRRFAKTEAVTVRLEQGEADRCPRNAKGKIEQDFIREAVSRELKRRGL
jgi:hypothetical protein